MNSSDRRKAEHLIDTYRELDEEVVTLGFTIRRLGMTTAATEESIIPQLRNAQLELEALRDSVLEKAKAAGWTDPILNPEG